MTRPCIRALPVKGTICYVVAGLIALLFVHTEARAAGPMTPKVADGEWVAKDFRFKSGATLAAVRLHYLTLGTPTYGPDHSISNAVLILHSTASSAQQFLKPQFSTVLFGPGQPLDTNRFYVIIPDSIGHGKSSKPSDGLHARFPRYDYDDMVAAQHELLTNGLGVQHLRLVMGTSMGCMHSWVWAETYPKFMDHVMPLGCQPAPVSGRNRMWRTMLVKLIRQDPGYHNGDYVAQPAYSMSIAAQMILIVSSGALELQNEAPTAAAADKMVDEYVHHKVADLDANDLVYALDASRNYAPEEQLGKIVAPLMLINFSDDFINPPELGIAEVAIKSVKDGSLIQLPVSPDSHGHLTHTWAAQWQQYLIKLMSSSADTP